MNKRKNQEVLNDKSASGKERPWNSKKLANNYLSIAYEGIDGKKSVRLRGCATVLVFKKKKEGGRLKLHTMDSCRVRLCPMCSWRRSLKVAGNANKIVEAMKKEKNYAYIFLTLTIKNCAGKDLTDTLDSMMSGWNRFVGYKAIKEAVKGWYRGLEITHNTDYKSNSFDTYHPHYHCLLAVNTSYFKNSQYIRFAKWRELWKKAMRLNYDPEIKVTKVKGNTSSAIAEAAKYAVKDKDYILTDDWDLTIDTVKILDDAVDHRRFTAYGGVMREYHRKLNLQDEMTGNLVNVDEDLIDNDNDDELVTYIWNSGYNQYRKE